MKLRLFSILVLALAFAMPVYASISEDTGTLTTGVQTGVPPGMVIVAPTASPGAGVYVSAQNVVLSASGAMSIHYTTDGTAPTCASGSVYGSAINVSASQIIQALSCYPNGVASAVSVFGYVINPPSAPAPSGGGGGGGILPTPTPTPGSSGSADIDHSGAVDVLDFNVLVVNWGSSPSNTNADLNHDGVVDIFDFNLFMVGWPH